MYYKFLVDICVKNVKYFLFLYTVLTVAACMMDDLLYCLKSGGIYMWIFLFG